MSFDLIETSTDSGQPFELVKVSYLTHNLCYTTAEVAVAYDGLLYTPMPMSHNDVSVTDDVSKSALTLRVPCDCPIGELFRVQPPPTVVTLTIFVMHVEDSQAKVQWKGRIVNAEWIDESWLELTSESAFSSLQRLGVPRRFSVPCQLAVYSQGDGMCNADPALHEMSFVVSSITGATIRCNAAAGQPASKFAGGKISWTHGEKGYLEQRMINESTSDGDFIMTAPPQGLIVGQTVKVLRGCDHTLSVCNTVFNNSLNYGGTPYIPLKNPFGGATLY